MSNIQQVQAAVAGIPGAEFRTPHASNVLDAIAPFSFGADGMKAARAQFVVLADRLQALGQIVERPAHLPPSVGCDSSYIVGELRVQITVTGGAYSAPLLGVTAAPNSLWG